MNKKGFANLMFIVIIIVLAVAAGYFALIKKPVEVSNNQTPGSETPSQPSSIAVIYPNGGEILNVGEEHIIKLFSADYSGDYKVILWLKNGDERDMSTVGSSPIATGPFSKNSYSWMVPEKLFNAGAGGEFRLEPGNNYFIEAQVYTGPEIDSRC